MIITSRLLSVRHLASLAAGVLLCACDAGTSSVEPLVGATPIAVGLSTTTSTTSTDLPRFQLFALAGEVHVHWDVESGACLIAQATGAQAGSVIQVRIDRSGNPLANCANVRVGYHYVARIASLIPGRYEVRLIDAVLGLTAYEAGRGTIVVPAGN
jgi:hypothetical protein